MFSPTIRRMSDSYVSNRYEYTGSTVEKVIEQLKNSEMLMKLGLYRRAVESIFSRENGNMQYSKVNAHKDHLQNKTNYIFDRGSRITVKTYRRKIVTIGCNMVTCPDRDSNPGHLVSQPDALTVTPQVWSVKWCPLILHSESVPGLIDFFQGICWVVAVSMNGQHGVPTSLDVTSSSGVGQKKSLPHQTKNFGRTGGSHSPCTTTIPVEVSRGYTQEIGNTDRWKMSVHMWSLNFKLQIISTILHSTTELVSLQ
ncbi:hypothetical protein ANN_14526 [Periplaneta americana]|uniref:Uncharacterized protein n=1 Tax=Periplaneta americana TaxID=6978 RepID=A0ABQ8SWK1_PERAM|nr:hypothetical protein ANN_14526 [Periplaneta americana]